MTSITVGSYFPQLADLSAEPPDYEYHGRHRPGGQSFTHCCLLALNQSLIIDGSNGTLSYADPSFVDPAVSISELLYDPFPCGAEYTGDKDGAPVITVSYNWCKQTCPGWELSQADVLQQWVGPLIQFIVPSLAFCTNVPRTRKLGIPDVVFRAHPRTARGLATYWIRLAGALIVMVLDTVVWLSVCFAFAGPMLLSAVYEYALDRKVLEFLSPPTSGGDTQPPRIPLRLRATLLLAVVCGNLRMTAPGDADADADVIRRTSAASSGAETATTTARPLQHNTIWRGIVTMVDEYEAVRTDQSGGMHRHAVSLSTKLKSLLNSQASFGSTVGASILFFLGGFIYTVIDSDGSLGDNDTAHALAFGMWWMVIPYIAIISCAMLAANSPSALEGLISNVVCFRDAHFPETPTPPPDKDAASILSSSLPRIWGARAAHQNHREHEGQGFWSTALRRLEEHDVIETTYAGRFRPVKLWKRGLNKRQWVQQAVDDYAATFETRRRRRSSRIGKEGDKEEREDEAEKKEGMDPDLLRKQVTLDARDCSYVAVGALFLVLAPTSLAFLLSYHTPRQGLSCRSLTYLIYAISQVCEMILWSLAARLRIRYGHGGRWFGATTAVSPIAKRFCWHGQVLVGFFAILAAVGGTLLQLIGVYRNCLCQLPATYWPRINDPDAYFQLSTNSHESILAAQEWWTVTSGTAAGLMAVVTALAWWHQRRLRKIFRDQADKLDVDEIF